MISIRVCLLAMSEDYGFNLSVTGGNVPDEASFTARVREALARGARKMALVDGYLADTDSAVRVLTGPVVGEVTANAAVIMVEVAREDTPVGTVPISAALFRVISFVSSMM